MRYQKSGQTILELFFILFFLTFLMAMSFTLFTVFDVSQKQVMLTRTQAFIELGNFSDFGGGGHGEDDPEGGNSTLLFNLGENTQGTRVDLTNAQAFQEAVQGELGLVGTKSSARGTGGNNDEARYWNSFRIPRATVNLTSTARLVNRSGNNQQRLFDLKLRQNLWITHNRSIDLQGDTNLANGADQFYTGSVKMMEINNLLNQLPPTQQGLLDNTDALYAALQEIAREDTSLADEAENLEGDLNAAEGLTGGADAALLNIAISLAIQAGFSAIQAGFESFGDFSADVAGEGASTAGGQAASGAAGQAQSGFFNNFVNNFFGVPDLQAGRHLYNFGQVMNFSSNVLNLANSGLALGGKQIEGLQIAAGVTGALGGVASGISNIGAASTTSGVLSGVGQTVSGVGSGVGLADAEAGRVLGIAGAGFSLAGGIASINEGFSKPEGASFIENGEGGGYWVKDGKILSNGVGRFVNNSGELVKGAGFQATSAIGGSIAAAGGIVSQVDPGSTLGAGLSAVGGAVATAGGVGTFAQNVQDGKFKGTPFKFMSAAGGIAAGISATGVSVATLTGNEELGEAFAYGAMAGGAVAVVGALGTLAAQTGEKIGEWSEDRAEAKAAKEQRIKDAEALGMSPKEAKEFVEAGIKQEKQAAKEAFKKAEAKRKANRSEMEAFNEDVWRPMNRAVAAGQAAVGVGHMGKGIAETAKAGKESVNAAEAKLALAEAKHAELLAAEGAAKAIEKSGKDGFAKKLQTSKTDLIPQIQQAREFHEAAVEQIKDDLPAPVYKEYKNLLGDIKAAEVALAQYERDLERLNNGEAVTPQLNEKVVNRGKVATLELERLLAPYTGTPAPGTPARERFTAEQRAKLAEANQYYAGVISQDRLAMNLIAHAEREIEGRIIVENDEQTRDQIREFGQRNAEFLAQHRKRFYAENHPNYYRFKRAELAYRRPKFMNTRDALNRIKTYVHQREQAYQRVKSVLLGKLEETARN